MFSEVFQPYVERPGDPKNIRARCRDQTNIKVALAFCAVSGTVEEETIAYLGHTETADTRG